jgi:hypothetical protein
MDLILRIGYNVIGIFRLTPASSMPAPLYDVERGYTPEPDSSDAFNEGCFSNE